MEMVRQVRTAAGIIVLQWNGNSSLLRWFAQSDYHVIALKNLIKFRGYLREYYRDTQRMIRTTKRKAITTNKNLFGTTLNIITHVDDLNSRIRFISRHGNTVAPHGYLTFKVVKKILSSLGRSIITLSEEHYIQQNEEAWKSDWMIGT
jgi:hypothetical protein|tara:strand:- start:208 stop:651 length:444 start_codon:yes stop_codon:yes gene_type:complete